MGSTHFRIYQNNTKAKLTAIADIDEKKRSGNWSAIIGNIGGGDNTKPINLQGLKIYDDGYKLINDPEIDLVDICLPTFLHAEFVCAALKAGKHVFCEKPMAGSRKEVKAIQAAATASRTSLMFGMCIRFWPEYQHAYNLVKSGKLGDIKCATFKRVSPNISGNAWQNWFMDDAKSGGALLDLHLHDTDVVRYFFGKPKAVTSFGQKGFRSKAGVDHAITNYDYGNDVLICAEGGWTPAAAGPFEMSFLIVGTKGTARLSETGYQVIYENGNVEKPTPAAADKPTGWHVEIDYLLTCLQTGKKPDEYVSVNDLADSHAVIEAELTSINKKKTVKVSY